MLADRKTAGRQEGRVTVNGFDKEPSSFARIMGYCEQFDTHSSGTTVEEAIRTSATLRLASDITQEQVRAPLFAFSGQSASWRDASVRTLCGRFCTSLEHAGGA